MSSRLIFAALLALAVVRAPALHVSIASRSIQPGELLVLSITPDRPAATMHVRAFDKDWPSYGVDGGPGWRALVGIDLDVAPGEYVIGIRADGAAGTERASQRVTVAAKAFPTRRLTVDDAFVNPPAEVQARIASEAAELTRLWQTASPTPLWKGPFAAPVSDKSNSAFGTRSVFNGEPRSAHSGADFLSAAGTPVRAPAGGRVLLARDLYFSGGTVMIDHGVGVVSLFAHLSEIVAQPDETVAAGAVVGKAGATGRVTGAHLHWAVRVNGARVDPLSLIALLGGSAARTPRP